MTQPEAAEGVGPIPRPPGSIPRSVMEPVASEKATNTSDLTVEDVQAALAEGNVVDSTPPPAAWPGPPRPAPPPLPTTEEDE